MIAEISSKPSKSYENILDGSGCVALPGLVDLHTHLREPGREDAETVLTGTRAAARGGRGGRGGGGAAAAAPRARAPPGARDGPRLPPLFNG